MSEYIEREALLEAVLNLPPKMDEEGYGWLGRRGVWQVINDFPATDVREVVLCRDCKNNYNTCLNHGINEPMCDFTDRKLREDDFCSRGEKREER